MKVSAQQPRKALCGTDLWIHEMIAGVPFQDDIIILLCFSADLMLSLLLYIPLSGL